MNHCVFLQVTKLALVGVALTDEDLPSALTLSSDSNISLHGKW